MPRWTRPTIAASVSELAVPMQKSVAAARSRRRRAARWSGLGSRRSTDGLPCGAGRDARCGDIDRLLAADSTQLSWAGIGNVDGQLWQDSKGKRLTPSRGIVGAMHRSVNLQTIPLVPPRNLLLHSDGVSARFDASSLDDDTKRDPQAMADAILARWGRERDDATIVVACSVDPDRPAE
jgi:hypothetical protein